MWISKPPPWRCLWLGAITATRHPMMRRSSFFSQSTACSVSYFLAAIAKPLIGSLSVWQGVFGARLLDRLGSGMRSAPRDALIASSVAEENRGRAFGHGRLWRQYRCFSGATAGGVASVRAGIPTCAVSSIWRLFPGCSLWPASFSDPSCRDSIDARHSGERNGGVNVAVATHPLLVSTIPTQRT